MESEFTDAEKRFVLAEIIKVSHIDVGTIVGFVKSHEISPDWFGMQVPGGRTMRQCVHAAELMFNMALQPPTVPSLKRKSFGDISEHLPKRQAMMSPTEQQVYPASRSFGSHGATQTQHQLHPQLQMPPHLQHQAVPPSLPQLQPQPQAQPVSIQPRPTPNGFVASPSASSPTVSMSTPTGTGRKQTPTGTGRKRGRPSKADREAWARANPTQPTGYAPITPAPITSVPIAPHPAPSQTQAAYSSSPVGAPAYQVFSITTSSDTTPKRTGNSPSTAEQQRSESVPRSTQPISSPGSRHQYERSGQQVKAEGEARDLREPAGQTGQAPTGAPAGPIPMEPPIHQASTIDRHSGSPFAPSALRDVIGPGMEQTRKEGQAQVANQA